MAQRTRIDAGIIVAYREGSHRILRDGCVVVEGNSVVHVGRDYDGRVDEVIDKRDSLLTPGFVNIHTHLAGSPLDKSLLEDVGKRQFSLSGLADMLPARAAAMDEEAARACVDFSMVELVRTGTTTVMEMGGIGDYVADAAERAGLRAYIADGYKSGRWFTRNGKTMEYEWFEEQGREGMKRAVELVKRLDGRAGGRIQGFLSPLQVDTCTEELLVASRDAAEELDVPIALHVSQSVFEFDEMVRRHALTPVEWLEKIGFLNERCILGHVIMPAGYSWVQFAGDDLAILAEHDASVAHCTWVFARRGLAMESFPHYQEKGVNMCLGTDTAPQSMIEALRWASVLGKVMARQTEKATAKDVFDAATLNPSKFLKRDDLGRIAPGAKADMLVWDMNSLFMAPLRDPIRNIVFNAEAEDLRDVMIDGQWVMQAGRVLNYDEDEVCANLQRAGERMWSNMGPGHWAGHDVDQLSPPTYPEF